MHIHKKRRKLGNNFRSLCTVWMRNIENCLNFSSAMMRTVQNFATFRAVVFCCSQKKHVKISFDGHQRPYFYAKICNLTYGNFTKFSSNNISHIVLPLNNKWVHTLLTSITDSIKINRPGYNICSRRIFDCQPFMYSKKLDKNSFRSF